MEDENKEGLEQEETEQEETDELLPVPKDIRETTESMAELISNMDYVFEKPFQRIPDKEMDNYENNEVYYVVDETQDKILAHKTKNLDSPAVYLFQNAEDAETWKGIGTTATIYQDHKLSVESETYSSLKERDDDEVFGEFELIMLTHEQAQDLFENYPDSLRTLEFRESRETESEEDDF
jgi:hypothetical protein